MITRLPATRAVVLTGVCAALIAGALPFGDRAVRAQSQTIPGCVSEAEPNDTADQAQPIGASDCAEDGTAVEGRLDGFEFDLYRLEIADESPTLRNVTIEMTTDAQVSLCLLTAASETRQCRQGTGRTMLPDLLLEPGEHLIEVRGGDVASGYELSVQSTGDWSPAVEAEPNDSLRSASPIDLALGVAGRSLSDLDYLAATIVGPSHLWEISVAGEGLQRFWWQGERGTLAEAAIDPEGQRAVMTDMLLTPGTHTFLVIAAGDYVLEAKPLGPPEDGAEREPNDSAVSAETYRIGERRVGRLPGNTDADWFRFSAPAPERLSLELTQPEDADIEVRLSSGGQELLRKRATAPGKRLDLDLWLLPGDYDLSLHPITPSAERYSLTTGRSDPFADSVDREPNDRPARAVPIPATLRWTGGPNGLLDDDWFVLPPRTSPGTVSVRVEPPQPVVDAWLEGVPLPLSESSDGELAWADVPAEGSLLLRIAGNSPYQVTASSDSWTAAAEPAPAPFEISLALDADTVAAYRPEGQLVEGSLSLANTTTRPLELTLESVTSDPGWVAALEVYMVTVPAGATQEIPVRVQVAPDAWADEPVRISMAAQSTGTARRSTYVVLGAERDVAPMRPQAPSLLPDALLGGLNVASSALGATPLEVAGAENEAALFDGVTPIGQKTFWAPIPDEPLEIIVDLAGDEPVPIAGMIVNPLALDRLLREVPREVELLLSTDGATWTSALAATVSPLRQDQSFVLEQPVPATHAMLRIISTHVDGSARIALGEWKIVAGPGATPDAMPRNIADPIRGGHVALYAPFVQGLAAGYRMLDADSTAQLVPVQDAGSGFLAVIGFNEGRAAMLERLVWRDPDGSDPTLRLDAVDIETSLDGPLGPWQMAGTWQLSRDGAGTVDPFRFDAARWARYVRITSPLADDVVQLEFPATIEVIEQSTDETYRSILGEWGYASSVGPYETLVAASVPVRVTEPEPGDTMSEAAPLDPGEPVADRVTLGSDVDWYRIEVPIEDNTLRLDVGGSPNVGVAVTVIDAAGDEVPTTRTQEPGGILRYEAVVEGGSAYYALVEQPPASIVIAYDTSQSMGPFYDLVIAGMREFAAGVEPGREAVMAFPFGYAPLLEDFVDEPYSLLAAVTDASLAGGLGTSNAEESLIDATRRLAEREGRRAILVVTDAESPTENLTPELWDAFDEVRPTIHAVHVSNIDSPFETRDRMRAWAQSSGGYYENATTLAEMTRAFDRLATWMRRPADYTLSAATSAMEHPPGRLVVRRSDQDPGIVTAPDIGVEIILDTSGSMRKRLEGVRRIDVARRALVKLVDDALPEGVPVGLRTFGGRGKGKAARCSTNLAVPLEPLDKTRMLRKLKSLRADKKTATPIAAAIDQAAADLAGTDGLRIIVLVTDGAESCKGDPEAAIKRIEATGLDMTLNVVGFALEDDDLKADMAAWAKAGRGAYSEATGGKQLSTAITAALSTPVRVFDARGSFVDAGIVGGSPLELEPGTYRVQVPGDPAITFEDVLVPAGQTVELLLSES